MFTRMVARSPWRLQPESKSPAIFSRGRKGHARLSGAGLLGCVRTGEFTPMALDNLRADAEAAFPRRTRRDADQTRRDILAAAAAEFSEKGYAGGRVDDIAARTSCTKRMIYYYFGGKEGLYATVLEEAYGGMRDAEGALRLDELPPVEAVRRLVETTFDHHADHPDFVR